MQDRSRSVDLRWQVLMLVCVIAVALLVVFRSSEAAPAVEPQQEVIRLETRVNQLEQRLYGIETNIRTLEQQSRLATTRGGGGVSAQDVALLQSQLQSLQLRLAEYECGLAKLDERTLSPAMRNARRQSARRPDPCRANVESPLRFPETRD